MTKRRLFWKKISSHLYDTIINTHKKQQKENNHEIRAGTLDRRQCDDWKCAHERALLFTAIGRGGAGGGVEKSAPKFEQIKNVRRALARD